MDEIKNEINIKIEKISDKARDKALERILTGYWTDKYYKEPENMLEYWNCGIKDDVCKYIVKCTGKRHR